MSVSSCLLALLAENVQNRAMDIKCQSPEAQLSFSLGIRDVDVRLKGDS